MMREDAFCMNTHIFFLKDSNNSFIAIKFFCKDRKDFSTFQIFGNKNGFTRLVICKSLFYLFFLTIFAPKIKIQFRWLPFYFSEYKEAKNNI